MSASGSRLSWPIRDFSSQLFWVAEEGHVPGVNVRHVEAMLWEVIVELGDVGVLAGCGDRQVIGRADPAPGE